MRALFRETMGLVPLSRALEDYISAPMLVMSESFGCEVHVDKSADKFAESIAWVRGTRRHPCLLYTSPSPRDKRQSRMPSSA